MGSLLQDVRYGVRTLLRSPGFTIVAILSLALGIGANTAIFSFINTILLKPLPVKDPQQLVWFGSGRERGNMQGTPGDAVALFSWDGYQQFQKNTSVFSGIVAIGSRMTPVYATDASGLAPAADANLVSGNFFRALGIAPQSGRLFDEEMDRSPGGNPYVVLSDGYWERRFHRDPAAIGRSLAISGHSYTVIGVTPRGFFGLRVGETPDFWIPLSMQKWMPGGEDFLSDRRVQFLSLVARLKSGVSLAQAQAAVNVTFQQMLPAYLEAGAPPEDQARIRAARVEMSSAERGASSLRRAFDQPLRILMAVVGLVLLIACANVAGLQAALAARRQRELALRVAMGAGRVRVMRQLLTESILLAAVGGFLGVLVAQGAGALLVHLISTGPRSVPVAFDLDPVVLAFTSGISLLTGLFFGIAPAVRAGRLDLNSSLKDGKSGMASPHRVSFGRAMVVGQVALSLALLVTAGLLLRSFRNLVTAETGFDRENVLLFKIDSRASGYRQDQRLAALYAALEERISRLPGVKRNGVSLRSFNEGRWMEGFAVPGLKLTDNQRITTVNFVTPAWFETMRVALTAGRSFEPRDRAGAQLVAIVSESFATRILGGPAAIGKDITMSPLGSDITYRIIGIARDVKVSDVREKPESVTYIPLAQTPVFAGNLAVRVSGDPAPVAAAVRRAITETEPNLPIRWTTTLASEVSDSLVQERAIAQLSAFFALLALGLAAVGLYGTISFSVARRTAEIGVRMALGAERSGVVHMVLRDALALVIAGLAIGAPLAFLAGRALQTMLYGLSGMDTLSITSAIAVLFVVAVVASLLPALRASRVDPITALRYE